MELELEWQYPVDVFYAKLHEDKMRTSMMYFFAELLGKKFWDEHSSTRESLGTCQRRQNNLYWRKLNGEPAITGVEVWVWCIEKKKSKNPRELGEDNILWKSESLKSNLTCQRFPTRLSWSSCFSTYWAVTLRSQSNQTKPLQKTDTLRASSILWWTRNKWWRQKLMEKESERV